MPAQFVYPIGSITGAPEHVTCHQTTNGDDTACPGAQSPGVATCHAARVGGAQEIDVRAFEHRRPRVWLELRACIRGPDTARADATVRAVVHSLRFARR